MLVDEYPADPPDAKDKNGVTSAYDASQGVQPLVDEIL